MDSTLRIGVLGLFHPQRLTVKAARLDAGDERLVASSVEITLEGDRLVCAAGSRQIRTRQFTASGGAVQVGVPGRIDRTYSGAVTVIPAVGELVAVASIPMEIAVASTVAAEAPAAPVEAMKAQAVVARSYYAALQSRHTNFDFCDTTHCQFLREAPGAGHPASKAAAATRGMILLHDGHHFGPMFFRSCGGVTLTAEQVKLDASLYPYFAVECAGCKTNPSRWEAEILKAEAGGLPSENARLALGRKYGWNRVASNHFVASGEGEMVVLRGVGEGHGLGMCQRGAAYMARAGRDHRAILAHYFPRTVVKLA